MTVRYDDDRKAWIVDNVTEISGTMFNNLLKWGQPYTPYDTGLFRHDIYDSGAAEPPIVVFKNADVLSNGFGQNVKLTDFDVVKKLGSESTGLNDGNYTLKQLQDMGLSRTGRSGDHVITTDLYVNQDKWGVRSELGSGNAAYFLDR